MVSREDLSTAPLGHSADTQSGQEPCVSDGEAAREALDRAQLLGAVYRRWCHDVRSPLNAATLHLSLLRRLAEGGAGEGEVARERLKDWVGQLAEEMERLSQLTEEAATFAPPPPDEPWLTFDLRPLLTELSQLLQRTPKEVGLPPSIHVDGDQPFPVHARRRHLRQALLCLLLGAAHDAEVAKPARSPASLRLALRDGNARLTLRGADADRPLPLEIRRIGGYRKNGGGEPGDEPLIEISLPLQRTAPRP